MTDELRSALADRYTLESEVGRGGMAVVFSARDLRHRRRVAIKVMSPEASAARTSDRFRQEIEVTAGLSHPHIVPLFDSGEVAGQLYFVMPLIEGETLRTRLLREGRLSLKDATHITREIAEALDFAHARGVVHRDVKPENILLANGHALLADFGIARASSGTSGLTGTGMFIGTPEYLSPECIIGDSPAGAPADVYALGCVVFEMLAGAPPFRGPTQQATLARRLTGLIPSVRDARPEVPPGIAAAITSALATDPAQRCPTCAALAAELASGVAHERGEPLSDVSLVVRPFQAVGETAELGDFADGLTDEVIIGLSKVRALRVISRASAMRLKDTPLSVREVGREYAVRYLVAGSVRRSGPRVRVSAEVIDTVLDTVAWSDRFDGAFDDPFALQEAVARGVATALHVRLTAADEARLLTHPVPDPRAADWIRRATSDVLSFTRDGIERAEALAAKAEEVVGANASLCVLRAMIEYQWLNAGFDVTDAAATAARVNAAHGWLDKATALGGQTAEVAFVRAWIHYGTGLTVEGVREASVALGSEPNHVMSLAILATILWANGFLEECELASDRLLALDPFEAWGTLTRAWCVGQRGNLALRDQLLDRAAALAPGGMMRFLAGCVCGSLGDLAAATRWWKAASAHDDGSLGFRLGVSAVAAMTGGASSAIAVARELTDHPALSHDPQWALHTAQVLSLAGETELSVQALERAVDCGLAYTEGLREADGLLTAIRTHPRFPDLLRRSEANREAIAAAIALR